MLCTRCRKRTAVFFITAMQGGEQRNEGLCLVCAKEMGIPQVREYMNQMGITDDEIEDFSNAMSDFSDSLDGDSFEHGGTANAIPNFISNLLGGQLKPFMSEKPKEKKEEGFFDEVTDDESPPKKVCSKKQGQGEKA